MQIQTAIGLIRGKAEKKWATDRKTQDESQWIVSQRILSALTIPGFK